MTLQLWIDDAQQMGLAITDIANQRPGVMQRFILPAMTLLEQTEGTANEDACA